MASVLENFEADYLFEYYLKYREETEAPQVFHRWALVGAIGALLGREFYLPFLDNALLPNHYIMFLGTPGTRKSSAIKGVKSFMVGAGFENFAAERTSKEKFLMDLAGENDIDDTKGPESQIDQMIGTEEKLPACVGVWADEFNDFVGLGNMEFLSILSSLWDYHGVYKQRLKNSKSIEIQNPTVNILAGNTPVGFSLAFPPESNGQGVLSRMLLIHGTDTGRKIAFPTPPDINDTTLIQTALQVLKVRCIGQCPITPEAQALLKDIYETWTPLLDPRFANYGTRRFTHLLKLCLVTVAARVCIDFESNQEVSLQVKDVIYANSMLTAIEHDMPLALGEYGASKQSKIAQTIMEGMRRDPTVPLTMKAMLSLVRRDIEKPSDLSNVLASMLRIGQIQEVSFGGDNKKQGYMIVNKQRVMKKEGKFDLSLLAEFQ